MMLEDSQPLILDVKGLSISFDGKPAVSDLSFTLTRGKRKAIVGESGSGKSVSMLAIAGLLPRNAALQGAIQLYLEGICHELHQYQTAADWRRIRGRHIGFVFQEPMSALNPVMTVGAQLRESIHLHQNLSASAARACALDWLAQVRIHDPASSYRKYPHQLSGGQRQRVMIAMALCNHPQLLIADEPTTALDPTIQAEIVALMVSLQEQSGAALLFVTHDLLLAGQMATDVLVMYRGRSVEAGEARLLLHQPKHPYTAALVNCRPGNTERPNRLMTVADYLTNGNDAPALQGKVPPAFHNSEQPSPVLSVKQISVYFSNPRFGLLKPDAGFRALHQVQFELAAGHTLGVVGESGSGKSTLARAIMGLLPVATGHIELDGVVINNKHPKELQQARRVAQLVFQDPLASLNPTISIGAMLQEVMAVHQMVGIKDRKKEAIRLLDLVRLPPDALDQYPHEFSGGQRQRLALARALAVRPKLLLLDESVSALDVSVQAEVLNLLNNLKVEAGLSYLFISHDMRVIRYMADFLIVLLKGEIVERGPVGEVFRNPRHAYTQKLMQAAGLYHSPVN